MTLEISPGCKLERRLFDIRIADMPADRLNQTVQAGAVRIDAGVAREHAEIVWLGFHFGENFLRLLLRGEHDDAGADWRCRIAFRNASSSSCCVG